MRAHDVADAGHVVIGGGVGNAQDQVERAQLQDRADEQTLRVVHPLVGDKPDDERKDQLADGGEGGAQQVERQNAEIGFEIGEKTGDQPAGPLLFLFMGIPPENVAGRTDKQKPQPYARGCAQSEGSGANIRAASLTLLLFIISARPGVCQTPVCGFSRRAR